VNVDELVAIDVHTHAEISTRMLPDEAAQALDQARGRYFKYAPQHPTIAQIAAYYRERKMGFVVFTVDHERGLGMPRISNEEVAESAAERSDVAIPFASIDPARGKMGVQEARRPIEHFGVKGFKFHPSVPWQDEALSVAAHKPQAYIDLSGWSPKYFPPQLAQYANTLFKHKVLFGTDYPLPAPDRWIADFATLDIKPEVRTLIMKKDAVRLLKRSPGRAV
jgi:predicted TIM-barrel fold metal-dependent hydrolase